jgi:tetratricopeptide (TPR) repeat protein
MPGLSEAQKKPGTLSDSLFMDNDSSMLFTYLQRARQRTEGGYFKGAVDDYNSAIKLFGTDAQLWLVRGNVKEKLKDLKGASEDYAMAIKLDSASEKMRLFRGNLFIKMGRYHEAVMDYTAAITLHPSDGLAYYQRALARQKLRQTAEGCADLHKAESLGMVVEEKIIQQLCTPKK